MNHILIIYQRKGTLRVRWERSIYVRGIWTCYAQYTPSRHD